jgi:hypothetical protein
VLTCNIRPALFDYVAHFLNSKVLPSAHVSESKSEVLSAGCWRGELEPEEVVEPEAPPQRADRIFVKGAKFNNPQPVCGAVVPVDNIMTQAIPAMA